MRIICLSLLCALLTACSYSNTVQKEEKPVCTVTGYEVVGSAYYRAVEKFTIDGHEYLVFSAKVANPPTVVHNECCPCKEK